MRVKRLPWFLDTQFGKAESRLSPRFPAPLVRAAVTAATIVVLASVNVASAQNLPTSYEVTGFRDARFGMSEQEVRGTVAKTLCAKPTDITSAPNPVEGTKVLTVRVASLDPVPGPAEISYIANYQLHRRSRKP